MKKADDLNEYLLSEIKKKNKVIEENKHKIEAMFQDKKGRCNSKDELIELLSKELEHTNRELAIARGKLNRNLISPEARMRINSDLETINQ